MTCKPYLKKQKIQDDWKLVNETKINKRTNQRINNFKFSTLDDLMIMRRWEFEIFNPLVGYYSVCLSSFHWRVTIFLTFFLVIFGEGLQFIACSVSESHYSI